MTQTRQQSTIAMVSKPTKWA